MTTDKAYPSSACYTIQHFYDAKRDVERCVAEMDAIRFACEITAMCRGDLTGRAYNTSYNGLEEATRLRVEFEKLIAEYKQTITKLQADIPAADFDSYTYSVSTDPEGFRHDIEWSFEEIKKYFNLTHKYYESSPAPERAKTNSINNLVNLAAYAALIYTVWHMFF